MAGQSQTVRIEVRNMDRVRRELRKLGTRAIPAAKAAVREECERVMTASKQEVPVDLGNLKNSGHVTTPAVRFSGVECAIQYGGPAAPYAVIVHENLKARHTVGKARYLVDPFNRAIPGMDARMAMTLERDWIGGGV